MIGEMYMKLYRKKLIAATVAMILCIFEMPGSFALEDAEFSGDLRWDFVTDAEGFDARSNGEILGVNNGALVLTASGNDPNITAPNIEIKTNEHRYLRFSIKNSSPSSVVQAYFYYANPWQCFNVNSIPVEKNSNEFKVYEVDLQSIENTSVINKYTDKETYPNLRFDFINNAAGSTVELDYIVLSSRSMKAEAQNLVSAVTVGDCPVGEFDSASDYCETGIYADVYSNLTAEDVAVTADSNDVKVKIKNVTDRKIIDITAVSADGTYANTYRIVCKSIRRPAEPTSVIIDKCEISGKTVSISGKLSSADSRSISLIAHPRGTGYAASDILYIGRLRSAADGSFSKSFTLYDDESTAKFYNIELVIDVDGESAPVYQYKYYVNNKKLDESLEELKNSGKGILEFVTDGDNEIIFGSAGIWIDLYKAQTAEIKDKINTAAEKYTSALTAENAARIANGSIMAVLTDISDDKLLAELTADYDRKVSALSVENKRFSELDSAAQGRIIKNIKTEYSGKLKDWSVFETAVLESMLLDEVNHAAYTSMKDLLLRNTDILKDDLSGLKNQTSTKISDEAMRIVTETARSSGFTSVTDLVDAVEDALTAAEKKINENKNSGSGSSGGGGGSKSYTVDSVPQNNQSSGDIESGNVNENKHPFVDLNEFEWAEDAISALYLKGAADGIGENKFAPDREVKREEFVKLICEAFELEAEASETAAFDDVESSEWYAPYVAKAVKLGIINGVGENRFGVGEKITREDMVTVLYRTVSKITGQEFNSDSGNYAERFSDYSMISDYARNAVGAFSKAGIVNGIGDGSFGAAMPANRAEAAVMIWRCMNEFEIGKL